MAAIQLQGVGASDFIPWALAELEQMKRTFGLAEDAEGQPIHFYFRTVPIPGGGLIKITSNCGHDTVLIIAPPRPSSEFEEPVAEETTITLPTEDLLPPPRPRRNNFLSKWPYATTYADLEDRAIYNVSLAVGASVSAVNLSSLGSQLRFVHGAPQDFPFEDTYDLVRDEGHEDFHRKFMVAAYRVWHDTTGGDDASAAAWGSYSLPYPSLTMPLRADGFRLAMAIGTLPVSQQIFVEASTGAPVLTASVNDPGTFTVGELVDDYDAAFVTNSDTTYPSGTIGEPRLRERWEFTSEVAGRWSNFTNDWASIGEVDTSTPWTRSKYVTADPLTDVILEDFATFAGRAFSFTTPGGISLSLTTDSYHYYETDNYPSVPVVITAHRDIVSAPAFDGFVLPTIPSLGLVVNQSIVAKITASEGYGTFSWIDYYGSGTFSYDGMDLYIEPTSAWPLDSLPSNLFNFEFGDGGVEGAPYAVPPAYVADRTHHSIPFGEMRNGSYSNKLITIHWPRADGYGICVLAVPSDYEDQVAALDGDARRTYQEGAIEVVLNNFASFDLIAAIHHVGEYAVLDHKGTAT